jgi:hypothetical protein
MAQLRIFTGIVLVVAGASWTADAWAADSQPPKAAPAAAASTPTPCTDAWSFVATDCTLTWHGITVYGAVDAGVGWQSHRAPWDSRSAVGASYLIQNQNRGPRWGLAPNGLSNSTIGIKETSRSAATSLSCSPWMPASIRIPCGSPTGPDRLPRTPASPEDRTRASSI